MFEDPWKALVILFTTIKEDHRCCLHINHNNSFVVCRFWFRRTCKRRANVIADLEDTPPPYVEFQNPDLNPILISSRAIYRETQQKQPRLHETLNAILARAGPDITAHDIEMVALGARPMEEPERVQRR